MGSLDDSQPCAGYLQAPGNLPSRLSSPLAELGANGSGPLHVYLSTAEVKALELALSAFKALQIDGHEICKDNFVPPANIRDALFAASNSLHNATGVCIVKGLNPSLYSDSDNLLLFLGLASFIGDKHGIQDKKGNVISHITDAKTWTVPYDKRHGAHTNQSLKWHSDMGTDILALQVRQVAAKGGQTVVASSWKIYNDLMLERPDVVQVLAKPDWPVHMSDRKSRYTLAPLLVFEDNKLLLSFDPSRLGAHPAMKAGRSSRAKQIPELTPTQIEALSVVSAIADRNSVKLDTDPGDLVFINNWAVLHSRSSYEDASSGDATGLATRRHLLRLWLRSSELGWKIPESMRAPWETAFGYTDEGYISGDHEQVVARLKYAVVPEAKYEPPKYTTGSATFVIEDSGSETEEDNETD
ncbi:taurine catabolism dioxygenase family protein [Sporothrix brasiliensis 5110]|uniref:Taurine catabolism dioxygenase family protein n=1 Tax=Sporothrix brasiliensis 5110 TaxID=1398154 RepID=A0A0C2ISK2_9PEZI|nr:taurine catabolism dioxygenase family protein [Sporothrix brasiliensis 5110]KIH92036.1 taurine catabolism dioxygenase family protein [Sporothrix brasiliensis 5110]